MNFTKREKRCLYILLLILPIYLFIDQRILDRFEVISLIVFALPLGLYIATDPERIKKH